MTPEQIEALKAPLDRKRVKERTQAGRTLSYVEGWHAIAEANRIFGFDGWMRETVEVRCVSAGEKVLGKEPRQYKGFGVTYIAKVKVTVFGEQAGDEPIIREGIGSGHGQDRDLGLAHESAIKESETDAMKRALMTFGNPFGLALYDKAQTNVRDLDDEIPERPPVKITSGKQEVDPFGLPSDAAVAMADKLRAECGSADDVAAFKRRQDFLDFWKAAPAIDRAHVQHMAETVKRNAA